MLWTKPKPVTKMHHHLTHQTNWQVRCSNFMVGHQRKRSLYSSDFILNHHFDRNWINFVPIFALLERKRNQMLHLEQLIFEVLSLISKLLLLVYMLNYYFQHAFYVLIFSRHHVLYFLSFWRSHPLKVPFHLRRCYLELDKLVQLFSISSLESSLFLNLVIQTFHSSL